MRARSPETQKYPHPGRSLQLGVMGFILFLGSCTTATRPTADIPAAELPDEININSDAASGGHLILRARLASGEAVPLLVDTGTTTTCLDVSFEPKLGDRLAGQTFWQFGTKLKADVCKAPSLYLGNTRLVTGNNVCVLDFQHSTSGENRVLGILGMDCLRHYCIQLDFAAGKIRFLNPSRLDASQLGDAFPLTFVYGCPIIHQHDFLSNEDSDLPLQIDTGYNSADSALRSDIFRKDARARQLPALGGSGNSENSDSIKVQNCVWNGKNYTDLLVRNSGAEKDSMNLIGLRFLARHLVTLDFPNQTLYLKQTSVGPLN